MYAFFSQVERVQLRAVIRKNILLNGRDRRENAREFLVPIILLAVLASLTNLVSDVRQGDVLDYPRTSVRSLAGASSGSSIAMLPCGFDGVQSNASIFARAVANKLEMETGVNVTCLRCEATCASGLPGEDTLLQYFARVGDGLFGAVVFDAAPAIAKQTSVGSLSSDSPAVEYRIRMDVSRLLPGVGPRNVSSLYLANGSPAPPDGTPGVYSRAFLPLQAAVDRAIALALEESAGVPPASPISVSSTWYTSLASRPFPSLAYDINVAGLVLSSIVPIYMTLIFTLQVRVLLTRVIEEKERRIKVTMQQMGLGDRVFWASWFITSVVKNTFIVTIVVAIACGAGIFKKSDPTLIWAFFVLFSATCLGFVFACTALFSSAATGGVFGMLIYLAAAAPSYALTGAYGLTVPTSVKLIMSLLSPCAFNLGTAIIILAENGPSKGIRWSSVTDPTLSPAGISLAALMGMLALDAVLYMFAAVWANAVLPSEYGALPSHPLFCLGFRRSAESQSEKNASLLRAARIVQAGSRVEGGAHYEAGAQAARHALGLWAMLQRRLWPGTGMIPSSERTFAREWPTSPAGRRTVDPLLGQSLQGGEGGVEPGSAGPSSRLGSSPTSSRADATVAFILSSGIEGEPATEPVSSDVVCRPCLSIRGLTKVYPPSTSRARVGKGDREGQGGGLSGQESAGGSSPRLALDGLTLDMYAGHVTCLLGHNGAGKTTAVSVLTGLYAPSEGDAFFRDVSLITQAEESRRFIGVCPQHDILFPTLTAAEHVALYAGIKGMARGAATDAACASLLERLGLSDKADSLANTLSGGQKRRLSVAIALIGDPPLVFLDEPTSGLDPAARRAVWSVVQGYKARGAVVVLTTHHMDEADILGDRIALMARGRLRVVGSPLFLKAKFGLGYHLVVTVPQVTCNCWPRQEGGVRGPGGVSSDMVVSVVLAHVPTAVQHSITAQEQGKAVAGHDTAGGLEIEFILPRDSTPTFPLLFTALDGLAPQPDQGKPCTCARPGPRLTYSVTVSTLEEVYLRLAAALEAETGDGGASRREAGEKGGEQVVCSEGKAGANIDSSPYWWVDVRRRVLGHSKALLSAGIAVDPNLEMRSGAGRAGLSRLGRQISVQMWRRATVLLRTPRAIWLQVITPVLFVALSCVFQTLRALDGGTASGLLPMVPSQFGSALIGLNGAPASFALPSVVLPSGSTGPLDPSLLALLANVTSPSSWPSNPYLLSPAPFGVQYVGQAPPASPHDANVRIASNATTYAAAALLLQPVPLEEDQDAGDGVQAHSGAGVSPWTLTLSYNSTLTNGPPVVLSALHNALLALGLSGSNSSLAGHPGPVLRTTLDPLPRLNTAAETLSGVGEISAGGGPTALASAVPVGEYLACTLAGLYSALGYITIPALQANAVVSERESGAKALQQLSGATSVGYWAATWAWDGCLHLLSWAAGSLILILAGPPSLRQGDNGLAVAVVMLAFAWASPAPTYVVSFAFKKAEQAQMWVRLGFSALLMVLFVSTFALSFPSVAATDSTGNLRLLGVVIKHVGMLFPPFALAAGIAGVGTQAAGACPPALTAAGIPCTLPSPWSWAAAGGPLAFLLLSIPVWAAILLAIETGQSPGPASCIQPPLKLPPGTSPVGVGGTGPEDLALKEDSDALEERERVVDAAVALEAQDGEGIDARRAMQRASDTHIGLLNSRLRKVFTQGTVHASASLRRTRAAAGVRAAAVGPKVAVADLSLSCALGEVLGLLGPNGAGKSTALAMMVGDTVPTAGRAWVLGLDVFGNHREEATDLLGYCPQTDALFPMLTARETLSYFCALSGVPSSAVDAIVKAALAAMDIGQHGDTRVMHLSGGNKRRLSLLVAYVGAPLCVLLDEPSTGVDPFARRRMHALVAAGSGGRCTLLTTHVMDEAEALCGRIGIMTSGRLACLGSPARLKALYGQGYTVEIRLADAGTSMGGESSLAARPAVVIRDGEREEGVLGPPASPTAVGAALSATGVAVCRMLQQALDSVHAIAYVRIREENGGHLRLDVQLPQSTPLAAAVSPSAILSPLFLSLEGARAAHATCASPGARPIALPRVLDYSVCAVTLESVFMGFAREQEVQVA